MISKRLRNLFYFSIPIFIAHGLEEYFTGLYSVDSHVKFMFGYFESIATSQAVFLLFQIMLWLMLLVSAVLIFNEKSRLYIMVIPAIIFIYELHHFWKAFDVGGYYPGLVTALLFPLVGYFYWKEWLKCIKGSTLG